ncbi:hypothetical protein UFOVP223_104 [uncultured Caudovirales phage]|uniref:Uncharacterized protein n=1 Tax=uncultured Caudovirales phage TaxID=2100421 RepID=A0A6J5L4G1_9CAUD|nr:hypothetical protein UFOVP110_60 [uncultured Caudovirales phage]CAB5219625.1 hypothetical protein UFOVP223_104 [uncultured Caudovirales phage]
MAQIPKKAFSERDAAIAADYKQSLLAKSYVELTDADKQIANIQAQIVLTTEARKNWALAEIDTANSDPTGKDPAVYTLVKNYEAAYNVDKIRLETLSTTLKSVMSSRQSTIVNQELSASLAAAAAATEVEKNTQGNQGTTTKPIGDLLYNASAVREAYFSNTKSFQTSIDGRNRLSGVMKSSNQPQAIGVAQTDLWNKASASKGMIVTSKAVLKAWSSNPTPLPGQSGEHNYGFQFHYNPGTVSMNYFTSPNVDVTMMTSGTEKFNLAGVSGSQGSVSFQIILNRLFDFQYYNSFGQLTDKTRYAIAPKDSADEKMLYEKGTMYDVEYLLRTLMGTTMKSYLRGENTADMGWLPAIPVELHLGKSLRYLGTINSVSLNHIIFDERMVPIFSTLNIDFVRLPDYPELTGSGLSSQPTT